MIIVNTNSLCLKSTTLSEALDGARDLALAGQGSDIYNVTSRGDILIGQVSVAAPNGVKLTNYGASIIFQEEINAHYAGAK